MPKLLFKTDGIVSGEVVFKAGEVYDISDETGSATRWIKRGAEVVEEIELKAPEQVEVVKKPFKKENKKEIKSSK
jgi:hypothetical protein